MVSRLLLVDDSTEVLGQLTLQLAEFADMKVVGTATSGARALRLVGSLKPDLVVLDMNMPKLNVALPPRTREFASPLSFSLGWPRGARM